MAYDAVHQRVVLYGGGETWEWDGVNWTQATPAQSPSVVSGHDLAYDVARQRVVLFGGNEPADPISRDWSQTRGSGTV